MLKDKIKYLIRSVTKIGQEKKCPFCGDTGLKSIDNKYLVTSLLKCDTCGLNHRHPKDDEKWSKDFYQEEYSTNNQMITDLPSDEEIITLKKENFPSLRSYDSYINALLKSPVKMIDYGCSWGFNVFKLVTSGYNAVGYEVSVPRAKFGAQKLDVPIYHDIEQLPYENDLVMSSHVIEHLTDINKFIDFAKSHLKENGVFMAFCPNGTDTYRKREPHNWHINWGGVHPNCLDVEFAKYAFKDNPYLILTGDWEFDPQDIAKWDGASQSVGTKLDGKELLIISKPNVKI